MVVPIFKKNRFINLGLLMTVSGVLGGVLSYTFQLLMGRILTPSDFSVFSASINFVVFLSSFLGAVGMLITRQVAAFQASGIKGVPRFYFWKIQRNLIFLGLMGVLLVAPFIETAQVFLKIQSSYFIWILYCVLIGTFFYSLNYSILQGLEKFYMLAFLAVAPVLAKIIFSCGLVYLGYGLEGAFMGVLLALVVMVGCIFASSSAHIKNSSTHAPNYPEAQITSLLPTYISTVALAAMSQLDITIVNWYFQADESATFIATAVFGKALLYVSGGFVLVLFPIAAKLHSSKISGRQILLQSLAASLGLGIAVLCIFYFYGNALSEFLYGGKYPGVGRLLPFYGLALFPIVFVILAEHFLLARGKVLFAWIFLVIAPLELLGMHYFHKDLFQIIWVMGFANTLMALIGLTFMWPELWKRN